MAYKTLQNQDLYGKGNDYEQTLDYVVQKDDNDKTTWRDGIYTKLAYDIKDPEGYNKRTVNTPQSGWHIGDFKNANTLSGETDGSKLFSPDYATAVSFGQPFSATTAVAENVFNADSNAYYSDEYIEKVPQGIDVASFRPVVSNEDESNKEASNEEASNEAESNKEASNEEASNEAESNKEASNEEASK